MFLSEIRENYLEAGARLLNQHTVIIIYLLNLRKGTERSMANE